MAQPTQSSQILKHRTVSRSRSRTKYASTPSFESNSFSDMVRNKMKSIKERIRNMFKVCGLPKIQVYLLLTCNSQIQVSHRCPPYLRMAPIRPKGAKSHETITLKP